MKIAFDATAMPARRAGAGVYTYQLARALAEQLPEEDSLLLFDRWGAFAPPPGRSVVQPVALGGRGRRMLWEQTALPQALRRSDADVFHSPHHSLPWRAPCPAVVTVHDVTFRLLPWRYPRARRWYMHLATWLAARRAAAVIVPSNSVRQDFLRLYGGPPRRVHVVSEAAPVGMAPVDDPVVLQHVRSRYGLPERIILSVGTLEPGKNRGALLAALGRLQHSGRPHHLVVVGQRGWGTADSAGAHPTLHERVHLTGYVPDEDLPALYTLADVFLFPSWREGFGLPPLEALACGTPVVASDRPAMPEVLGDAALYAPPDRPELLAEAVERILDDPSLAERLSALGRQRAALFSWERAARETLAVYRTVCRR